MTRLAPVTYTLTEVAQLLGTSRSTVYRMAKADELPVITVGAHYRVPKAAFENYLRAADPYADPIADAEPSAS